jgi:hypothetical protein
VLVKLVPSLLIGEVAIMTLSAESAAISRPGDASASG